MDLENYFVVWFLFAYLLLFSSTCSKVLGIYKHKLCTCPYRYTDYRKFYIYSYTSSSDRNYFNKTDIGTGLNPDIEGAGEGGGVGVQI